MKQSVIIGWNELPSNSDSDIDSNSTSNSESKDSTQKRRLDPKELINPQKHKEYFAPDPFSHGSEFLRPELCTKMSRSPYLGTITKSAEFDSGETLIISHLFHLLVENKKNKKTNQRPLITHNMSTESNDEGSLYLQIPASPSDEAIKLPSYRVARQLAFDRIINKIGMGKFQKQLLVHRVREATAVLRKIAKINGNSFEIKDNEIPSTTDNSINSNYVGSSSNDNSQSVGCLSDDEDTDGKTLIREVLRDYLIYSVCGIPGSLFGSFLIETTLGRKGSMALATFGTSLAVFLFSTVRSRSGEVISSAMVSFLATLNYAVIYGYTPEVFEVKLRGTARTVISENRTAKINIIHSTPKS
ncbi:16030_t:CDS:2, partial [Racocetra fulgida]